MILSSDSSASRFIQSLNQRKARLSKPNLDPPRTASRDRVRIYGTDGETGTIAAISTPMEVRMPQADD